MNILYTCICYITDESGRYTKFDKLHAYCILYIRQYCYSYYHKTPLNIKYLPLGYSSGMYKHIQDNNSYNSYSSTSYDIEYLVNKPRKYNWMFIGMNRIVYIICM